MAISDFRLVDGGTIFLLHPITSAAREWVECNLPEDCPKLGTRYAIEHRFIADIIDGIKADGLEVK